MPKIVISYRRADSRKDAGRIYDRMANAFGKANIFKDVDNIPVGMDFRGVIAEAVANADVMLVIIGRSWLTMTDSAGNRRLDDPADFVRIEAETGLNRDSCTVIPVLVDNAHMPAADDLPVSLRELAFQNAAVIRDDPDFHRDVTRLIEHIRGESGSRTTLSFPALQSGNSRWLIGIIALLTIAIALYVILGNGISGNNGETPDKATSTVSESGQTEEATEDIAVVATETETATATDSPEPTDTATATDTPTSTETPTETLDPLEQIAMEFTQTAEASALFASATAAKWTYTPSMTNTPTDTPTATQTYTPTTDYTRIYEETRDAFVQTLTATYWTDTPTVTNTPTDTPTPTYTPTPNLTATFEAALFPDGIGRNDENPVTANEQWQVVEQDFDGVTMVLVPAGCFMMGSNSYDDEKPIHEQCFEEPFWIDKTEVTRAMWNECVADGDCEEKSTNQYSSADNQPVNYMSWFNARDYCEWRETRLPTEREWGYAARGVDNLTYPWGNEFIGNNVVYNSNSGNKTAAVGSRPEGASWVGAMDMSGNLWEWVNSIYQSYPYDAEDGRESNSDTNSYRVLRGGAFFSYTTNLRGTIRNRYYPSNDGFNVGFRCVRSY